jgi:preprotein translocase subunit YajC
MARSLEVGDEVLTSSGIYGSIVDLDGEVVALEVAEGVRLRIARMAIGQRLGPPDDEIAATTDLSGDAGPSEPPTGADPDQTIGPPTVDEP